MKKKIALIYAMEIEARLIIEELGLKRDHGFGDPLLPFEHYFSNFNGSIELLLSLNGKDRRFGVDNIGTEPATLNAYLTLRHFQPDLLINAGTAGGFLARDAKIGEVYLSTESFRFHDRRYPIPGFDKYGVGNYPVFLIPGVTEALGLKEGRVTTGNSLDCSDKDLLMIAQNNGSVKEMEAAGIGWVAHLLGVPFFALKAVTDFIDSSDLTEKQFLANLDLARRNLQIKTMGVLNHLLANPTLW